MDIILVSHKRGRTWRVSLQPGNILGWVPVVLGFGLICATSFAVGYGVKAFNDRLPVDIYGMWAGELQQQRAEVARMREEVENNTQALARRLARLHAHVMRLDAAGSRLTEIANLDRGEFDFSQPPPLGGPESDNVGQPFSLDQVLASLDTFDRQLSDRERQMRVLEDLLLASRLQKEVKPSGWPVETGWISSSYGMRMDPFSGLRSFHAGVDFAGREGSDVLSVAAGIVTEVGERFGYGLLVEINHGNGYVTRYGHNSSAVVRIGDRVAKGQAVARIGSSGRSTGPHVHFEVLLNGRVVDPQQYIQAAR
ncbi:MAG: M23 family metallopeptidase [Gammaproteobacteria bacterium]|nr:M23 family metallopeptidase [Gammaproteobacteria bacterium]